MERVVAQAGRRLRAQRGGVSGREAATATALPLPPLPRRRLSPSPSPRPSLLDPGLRGAVTDSCSTAQPARQEPLAHLFAPCRCCCLLLDFLPLTQVTQTVVGFLDVCHLCFCYP